MSDVPVFFFDLASPYSYLASTRYHLLPAAATALGRDTADA
jgi:2-hydroxychromene-2-carboxylate isomerase